MKTIQKLIIILTLAFSANALFSQSVQDTTMLVNGVCGMCERVIEGAANDLDGVQSASWDKDTKILQVSFNSEKLNLQDISKAIIKSGYDTEYETAADEDYYGLHKCCYYRDPAVVKDHENE